MADDMNSYLQRFKTAADSLRRKHGLRFKEGMERLQLELTGPQFYMLHLIHEHGPCSVSMLAEKLEVKPSAITVMMDRLVQASYVHRYHDEKDRRVVLVQMTESGEEVLEKVRGVNREILADSLSRLELEEIDVFLTLFEKAARS
jgi:DNA-binding MarR family transcriptional regulator